MIADDDEFDDFYIEDDLDCDCPDYDTDLIEGRAWCHRCGRRWDLTAEQVKREIQFQADYMAQFEQADPSPSQGKVGTAHPRPALDKPERTR